MRFLGFRAEDLGFDCLDWVTEVFDLRPGLRVLDC